jgi:predicted Zn-dependent protease
MRPLPTRHRARREAAARRRGKQHRALRADGSRTLPRPGSRGEYASPSLLDAALPARSDWYAILQRESQEAGCDARIVDWEALVDVLHATQRPLTSEGGDVLQRHRYLYPSVASPRTRTASRSSGRLTASAASPARRHRDFERTGFAGAGRRVADEALELLLAPNCPSGRMDVLLAPDQMVLQIHESIGHPLELDRILGDERNFAGTSFVTPDMFGTYRYGSEHLNITFDPTRPEELASYAYDDEGTPAEKTWLIRDGVLERPLGGAISQSRAGLPGVANSRAASWNRPPIDRMANLNLEPGTATFDALVEGIEHGVLLETNASWSIDDSRNKFQFGCERGTIIENGKLRHVVKNPNYRGISAEFWRSLARVGNADTVRVLGTPYCGKGEPSQTIRVGHASPACVFTNVDVFGGEA